MNNFKVLSPKDFSGSNYGDFGFSINGIKSDRGYSTRNGARDAMHRQLDK